MIVEKVLIVGDPLPSLDYPRDTTVCLMKELFRNKFQVSYLDFEDLNPEKFQDIKVRKLQNLNQDIRTPFQWSELEEMGTQEYDILLHRKDPPVNQKYREVCEALAQAFPDSLHINNPRVIGTLSEKLSINAFPQYAVPSITLECFNDLLKLLKESSEEKVLKPLNLFSGQGVHFVSRESSELTLKKIWKEFGPQMVLQPYIPEAEKIGDLRVLTFHGRIMGAFLRKAKEGSRLQNLHQGGSAHPWILTRTQERATREICEALSPKGLHLLGIDFLGDKLNEINFTSPMGFVQINEIYNTKSEALFIEELHKLIKEHTYGKTNEIPRH